jgi:CBS domain-containing membrane protein
MSANQKNPFDKGSIDQSLLTQWLHYFGEDQAKVAWSERFRAVIGVFFGLLCTVGLGKLLGELVGVNEWMMASLGASALLIFVLPSSPMAQPWAVIGGNTISAFFGIACAQWIANPVFALPAAAAAAILGMFVFRCLHPPAAAVALIAVLGKMHSYRYAFFPVMIDSVALCLVAMAYNTLTGKQYPIRPSSPVLNAPLEIKDREQAEATLDKLLSEYQEVMDVDRAELIKIIQTAEARVKSR